MNNKFIKLFLISRFALLFSVFATSVNAADSDSVFARLSSGARITRKAVGSAWGTAGRWYGNTRDFTSEKWAQSAGARKNCGKAWAATRRFASSSYDKTTRLVFEVCHKTNCIPVHIRNKDRVEPFVFDGKGESFLIRTFDGLEFALPAWVKDYIDLTYKKMEVVCCDGVIRTKDVAELYDIPSATANALYVVLAFVEAAAEEFKDELTFLAVDAYEKQLSRNQHRDIFTLAKRIIDPADVAAELMCTAYANVLLSYTLDFVEKCIGDLDSAWADLLKDKLANLYSKKFDFMQHQAIHDEENDTDVAPVAIQENTNEDSDDEGEFGQPVAEYPEALGTLLPAGGE